MRAEMSHRIFALLLATLAFAANANADIVLGRDHVEKAAAAYDRGDFAASSEFYASAITEGLDHADVHFDLGNAYFKQGHVGRAIASYSRAARLAPRNERIGTNLERARAQLRDRELMEMGGLPPVLKPIPWVYGRLSLNEWWTLALAGWIVFVLLRIVGQWMHVPKGLTLRVSIALLTLVLLSATMGTIRYRTEVAQESAIVLSEEVDVRSGPGSEYNLAFRVHEGLTVKIAERRDDWARIDLGGELVGWIPAAEVEPL